MQITVFVAAAIDEAKRNPDQVRVAAIVEECGCKAIGAGIGGNPIVPHSSPKSHCRAIIRQDLMELSKAHAILIVTDGKTFSVGTWVEMWEAHKQGQYIILYLCDHKSIPKSVFLRGLVDYYVVFEADLRTILIELSLLQGGG